MPTNKCSIFKYHPREGRGTAGTQRWVVGKALTPSHTHSHNYPAPGHTHQNAVQGRGGRGKRFYFLRATMETLTCRVGNNYYGLNQTFS